MATDSPNSVEMTGKTVDDAVLHALRRLGKSRNQVDVHVITEGRPGVFGIGATEARVRVSLIGAGPAPSRDADTGAGATPPEDDSRPLPKIDDYADYQEVEGRPGGRGRGGRGRGRGGSPPAREARPPASAGRGGPPRGSQSRDSWDRPDSAGGGRGREGGGGRGRGRGRGGYGRDRDRDREPIIPPEPLPFDLIADPEFEPEDNQDPTEFATAVCTDLVRLMRLEANVSARPPETPMDGLNHAVAVLEVTPTDGGEDLDILVGRNGEHLAALQYVVNLIVNRALEGRHAFTVDVDGYKRRREQELHAIAAEAAAEARETHEMVELQPMSPAERRIIHLTLSEESDIETESAGAGDARRVQILYRSD